LPKILVIDDDPHVSGFLHALLTREGYEVELAADGAKGLKAFEAAPSDLVITDIIMPEREGIEVITQLRKLSPSTRIIAISGGGRMGPDAYLPLARNLGASRAFAKPLDKNELLAAVRELLHP
jgi:DNA-binding response OmpR family regulator